MAQNFGMGLQVKLKTTKSDINKQISEIQNKITKKINLDVKVNITKKNIEDQLDKIKGTKIKPLNIKLKIDDDVGYINSQIKNISSKLNQKIKVNLETDISNVKQTTERATRNVKQAVDNIQDAWGKAKVLKLYSLYI